MSAFVLFDGSDCDMSIVDNCFVLVVGGVGLLVDEFLAPAPDNVGGRSSSRLPTFVASLFVVSSFIAINTSN